LTPSIQNYLPVPDMDECILNISIGDVTNDVKAFDSVMNFLDMVYCHPT